MYDAVVIGAGVVGCAVARELSRKKGKFLVAEREEDVCCGTSKANSAIIHAGFDAPHGTLMARLNVRGSQMMPDLAAQLDIPYQRIGSLVVMMKPEDRPALQALYENGLNNQVQGLRILEREELRQMEPHISDQAVAALYAPTGAIVCPFEMTFALAENAAKNGVRFQFDTRIEQIRPIPGGWALQARGGEIRTRAVVNAAGVYADELHNQVSQEKIHITPRRGDYFLLDHTARAFVRHTVFQLPGKMGKGVLVTPTVHGNILVGPTAIDVESKEDTSTTRAGLDLVREKSGIAVKDLPLNQTITSFSGLRAHEDHHEFIVREVAPGFVDCAGIESPGLSSAPAIGEMAAGILSERLGLEDNPDFDGSRTGIHGPSPDRPEEASAMIRENPAYGTVVCRCEMITEGQILDAIHRTPGARSVDGVKRRVRAGMGRCQGGFCSPRVMELLSRELGIPLQEVTKSGGASRYMMGQNKQGTEGGGEHEGL